MVERGGERLALTSEHALWQHRAAPKAGHGVRWRDVRRTWKPVGTVAELSSAQTGSLDFSDSALVRLEVVPRLDYDWMARAWSDEVPVRRIRKVVRDPVTPTEALAHRAIVAKVGATTRLTVGVVEKIPKRIKVRECADSPETFHVRPLSFVGYTSWNFCDEGDSGSCVWCTFGDGVMRPLALLCSTSFGYRGIGIPIMRVLDVHGATIVI